MKSFSQNNLHNPLDNLFTQGTPCQKTASKTAAGSSAEAGQNSFRWFDAVILSLPCICPVYPGGLYSLSNLNSHQQAVILDEVAPPLMDSLDSGHTHTPIHLCGVRIERAFASSRIAYSPIIKGSALCIKSYAYIPLVILFFMTFHL